MKFTVSMKDPDALDDQIRDAARESVATIQDLSEGEREALVEKRCDEAREICGRWFEYGEYLVVEVDTGAKTCTVKVVRS